MDWRKDIIHTAIPKIFSKVSVRSPLIAATSVTLKWKGLPDSEYEILLSENQSLANTLNVGIKTIENQVTKPSMAEIIFPATLIILLLFRIKQKKNRNLFFAFVCLCLLVNCDKEDTTNEDTDNTIEFSKIIDEIEPNTTYYWKIKSTTGYTDNFFTETATQSFKTLSD